MRGVSRPPRYDRFDIPPYYDATYAFFAFENLFSNHNGYFTTNLFACQVFLSKITHFILFIFIFTRLFSDIYFYIFFKGLSHSDAEVVIWFSSAYKGTPESQSAAKKHI